MYFWTLLLEYNTNVYDEGSAPKTFDLLNLPEYKGQVVVSDPARSAAGLGFIKTMVHWKGWDWVEQLAHNDPLVVAIGPGRGAGGGQGRTADRHRRQRVHLVYPQAGRSGRDRQPPAPVLQPRSGWRDEGTLPNPDGAELLVEYLTSREVHEMFRESGWFPCRIDVGRTPTACRVRDALDLMFVSAPSIGMSREDIAGRFHKMLQASN